MRDFNYRMQFTGSRTNSPDKRISEDISTFIREYLGNVLWFVAEPGNAQFLPCYPLELIKYNSSDAFWQGLVFQVTLS